jgi:hypothetical protein
LATVIFLVTFFLVIGSKISLCRKVVNFLFRILLDVLVHLRLIFTFRFVLRKTTSQQQSNNKQVKNLGLKIIRKSRQIAYLFSVVGRI